MERIFSFVYNNALKCTDKNMNKKVVLVTGIGGNVAQSILRIIQDLKYNIRIIGVDIKAISGGNHLCDKVYKVPQGSSPKYISVIKKICRKEKVDLIIPSTDQEIYYLARAREKLPEVAASEQSVGHIFLDKYETWLAFKNKKLPFAETRLPSKYRNDFNEFIVKPKEGVGSKGISINPKNPKSFSDDYIIQNLYKGKEITTAFYVTKSGELLSHITFIRSLFHGTTTICEVTFNYDKPLEKLIRKIIDNFEIRGSCDLQAIVDRKGNIIPFELNCRLSGTNSIRAKFGFEDVKYTLEEYLFYKIPKKPSLKKGSAVRIWMDIIYPGITLKQIRDKSTKHYIF